MSGITPCHGEIDVSIADVISTCEGAIRLAADPSGPRAGPSVALVGELRRAHGSDGDGDGSGPRHSRAGGGPRSAAIWLFVPGRGFGGDEETRTPDPLLAKEMLFQLSYVPRPGWWATLDSNQ